MIAKINELKRTTTLQTVKTLCETTIAAMSSVIYNGVTNEARFEIERVTIENLFEKLALHKKDKLITEWLTNQQRIYSIKNIGVRKAINVLKETEAKHDQTLQSVLEHFEDRLTQAPEVLLYEEFVTALSDNYNYVPAVTDQIVIINEKAQKYNKDLGITKIIETMKASRSNYLLPLIEDVVDGYLSNKTEQTKSHLKETLVKFSYDPHVRELINIVMSDATSLQLEYANAGVAIETTHSPLMYLGENEVVFNMKGSFYIKKGNNVSKLKKVEVAKLDESFRSLCEAVNLPNVEISKKEIKVYVNSDKAVINESSVLVNDKLMSSEEFSGAAEVSQWVGNTNFFMLTETLRNNFDEIVEIDFAKRVYLKENEGYAADIIKLRNNIFITTYDPDNNKSTFFRNINPIQASTIMKEHMNFDVSATFSDILPNKEKILNQINEAKKSYIEYINTLQEKINVFKNGIQSDINEEVLDALNIELSEVKTEYKDYVNEIEKFVNVSEGVTVSIDVDGEKYTIPIPQKSSSAKGETTDDTYGTVIGAEHMDNDPASEITFNNDETELLGDAPSIQGDEIDLGVDNVEASADAAEAGNDEEQPEEAEGGEDELGLDGDTEAEGGEDELGLDGDTEAEGGEDELGLGDEEEDEEEPKKKKEEAENVKYSSKKDISEEGGDEEVEEISTEEAPEELEKTDLGDENSEGEAEVEDVDIKEKKPNAPKIFLRKKLSESVHINLKKNLKKLNEGAQIGDTVMFDKNKGYVIGQTNDGDLLIQVQGSSHKAKPADVKVIGEKEEPKVTPQYKFDKKTLQNLTTKALFEQYVHCGIYMNNTPVKLNECYVRFNEWNDATDEKPVNVLIEGRTSIMPKIQIRILENINDFANPDNYVDGVIIDEQSGEATENIKINVIDYTNANGDADEVRIIKYTDDNQSYIESVPIATIKTLSV